MTGIIKHLAKVAHSGSYNDLRDKPTFTQQTFVSGNITLPAGGAQRHTFNIAKSGYKPISVIYLSSYHGAIVLQEYELTDTSLSLTFLNTTNASKTTTYHAIALYISV